MSDSSSSPLQPRPELARFESYKPGLSVRELVLQYGLKKVIKLASNENPLGPSPKGEAAYKKAAGGIHRYPESRSIDLRRTIAERFKLDLAQVIIGAGSDEIIELLAKTFLTPNDDVVVSASSFMQYRISARIMGANVLEVPMKGMKHDLVGMAAKCTGRTKFVFIANPNNPTGTYNGRAEIEKFLTVLPVRVVPVFDEAYFEYAATKIDYPSMIEDYFNKRPMVVLRTFSKIYGLPGLRVGFGVAPEALVSEMDKIRPPFNVSVPAQAAALAAMDDLPFIKKSVLLNEKEKEKMLVALSALGFEVIPSAANFLLFKVSPWKGRALFDALLQKSIIARSVDEYGLPDYLRITIGDETQNKKFLEALREVLNKT